MTPERETAHLAHRTGHRWLDLTLALSAMFVSVMSLVVAVRHGTTMDRLVAANSWPFPVYGTDNEDPQGRPRIALKIINMGIGPARIQTFELWWHDEPMRSANDLLTRCCGFVAAAAGHAGAVGLFDLALGNVAPRVLRAGDAQEFVSLPRTDSNADVWQRLNGARVELKMRTCYCSVFDECWVSDLKETTAKRVPTCPSAKVPFAVPPDWFAAPQAVAHSN